MNGIRQLIQIVGIVEYRTRKENEIKGIGLIDKPQII